MVKFHARLPQMKLGPEGAHYFRNYAVSLSRDEARGGFTSHGFKVGKLTINLTRGTWAFDTPGRGGLKGKLPAFLGGRSARR